MVLKRKPKSIVGMSFEDALLHGNDSINEDSGHERPERHSILMEIAHVIAKRGTCSRAKVGAVIAKHDRTISTGYNGAPSGMPHCNHYDQDGYYEPNTVYVTGLSRKNGCEVSEHAERNAIAYAARFGLATDGCTLYTTHAPCANCARMIINSGIVSVYYETPYRITEGVELLTQAGVEVVKL